MVVDLFVFVCVSFIVFCVLGPCSAGDCAFFGGAHETSFLCWQRVHERDVGQEREKRVRQRERDR